MKRFFISMCMLILLTALCMAAGEEESSSSSSTVGGSISFMLSENNMSLLGGESTLEEITRLYREQTGTEVEIVSVEFSQYEDILKVRTAAGDMPDIFFLPYQYDWLKGADALQDLTPLVDQVDFYTDPVRDDGKVYGVPFIMDAGGLVYNRDILDMFGIPFDRSAPFSSREDFDRLPRYFDSYREDFLAGGSKDFPLEAYLLFDLCLTAEALYFNPRFPEELAEGRAGLHDEIFMRASKRAAALFAEFPASYLDISGAEAIRMFREGECAVIPAGTWSRDLFSGWDDSRFFSGFPSSSGELVLKAYQSNLAISGYSDNKNTAADFIQFILTPEIQKIFTSAGNGLPAVRGVEYPEDPKKQIIRVLDRVAYIAGTGFFDMMIAAGVEYDDILEFYSGLYRAGLEGRSVVEAVDRLSDTYYRLTGLREPAPSMPPAIPSAPSRDPVADEEGPNAPGNP